MHFQSRRPNLAAGPPRRGRRPRPTPPGAWAAPSSRGIVFVRSYLSAEGVLGADLLTAEKMHFRKMHFSKILQIFGGLVLGCIKTKFCKKICVRQHFSSSTRFASFCTAAISKFSQKIGLKKQQFSWNFSKKIANVAKFAKFCQISKISAWESGRFWKMLQNAYFLAKIGADTAENEQHFAQMSLEARSGSLLAFDGRRTDPLLPRRSVPTNVCRVFCFLKIWVKCGCWQRFISLKTITDG